MSWTAETRRIHGVRQDFQPDLAAGINFYAPASRPVILAAVENAIATGTPYDLELQLLRADGRLIWVRAVGSVIRAQDKVVRLYGAFQDITERVERQKDLLAEHQRVVLATDSSGIGVWELDIASGDVTWDSQMYRLFGLDPEEEAEAPRDIWPLMLHPEDRERVEAEVALSIADRSRFESEFRIRLRSGAIRYLRALADVVVDPRSGQTAFLRVNWDVTQMRNITADLAEQHEWMRVTLRSIGDAVITTDDLGVVTWLNPVAEFMTGWALAEAIGRPIRQIFHILNERTLAPAQNPIETCLRERRVVGLEAGTILISRSGQRFGIEDSAAPIRDDKDKIRGVVMVFHDVTDERRIKEEMAFRATHDQLTGMKNRAVFEQRLADLLARAREEQVEHSLLFIDLDNFKLVNDTCGHGAGDTVLKQVAEILEASIRKGDSLARIGGDEFGILLEHCSPEDATSIAQKICAQMELYRYNHGDQRFRIGTSIGVVSIDGSWPSAEAIVQAADAACLDAKEAGRNRVRVWTGDGGKSNSRLAEVGWVARIERALERGQFELHIQEVVSLDATRAGRRGEVLIRLREEDGGLVLPGQFLPSAERFNLIGLIDRWVLTETLKVLREPAAFAGIDCLSINISGRSVSDRAFHRFAAEVLAMAGPKICQKLIFEITETTAVNNATNAAAFIDQMHDFGLRIALDDFGAGAASFGHLRALKVDMLKIDGQFIQGFSEDPLSQVAVRCFVDVARVLGIPTVAEWVERPELIDQLGALGVSFAQGFQIARPVPIGTFFNRSTRVAALPVEA